VHYSNTALTALKFLKLRNRNEIHDGTLRELDCDRTSRVLKEGFEFEFAGSGDWAVERR
jgi:hypothetical protein